MAAVAPPLAPSPETFDGMVADAQREIAEGVTRAGLQRDPYGHALRALGMVLGTFPELVKHLEATRQPVQDADLRRGVAQGISAHAATLIQSLRWWWWLAGCAALIVMLLIGGGIGYWQGYQRGITSTAVFATLPPADAAAWQRLMADNSGNAAGSLKRCEAAAQTMGNGRRACGMPVWIDPSAAVPGVN